MSSGKRPTVIRDRIAKVLASRTVTLLLLLVTVPELATQTVAPSGEMVSPKGFIPTSTVAITENGSAALAERGWLPTRTVPSMSSTIAHDAITLLLTSKL